MISIERLSELDLPEVLTSRELFVELFSQGAPDFLEKLDKTILGEIVTILRSSELQQLTRSGQLTLAMIKPTLAEGSLLAADQFSEDEQNQLLLSEIQPPLEVAFQIVLQMDDEMIQAWYGDRPKENQSKVPPYQPERYGQTYSSRWEEFLALMHRGPVTFVLLADSNGNAIDEWRQQMGSLTWNPEVLKEKQPDSLRARFAKDKHNNIFHGSDSPDTATREIGLLADLIERSI